MSTLVDAAQRALYRKGASMFRWSAGWISVSRSRGITDLKDSRSGCYPISRCHLSDCIGPTWTRTFRFAEFFLKLAALLALTGCVAPNPLGNSAKTKRAQVLPGTRATYCNAPRKTDGRVDVDRLV